MFSKMKTPIQYAFISTILLSLLVSGCGLAPSAQAGFELASSQVERQADPPVEDQQLQSLVQGNTAFALHLYQALRASQEGDSNLFTSPYSISAALAMTYAGARGETEAQMADTLHFTLSQDELHPAFNALDQQLSSLGEGSEEGDNFKLNIANSLWGQKGYTFLPEFLDLLARSYGAGLRLLDFSDPEKASQIINGWVEEQTEDKIKDLVPAQALSPATRLVLANAIYFNALWQHPFQEGATQEGPFTLIDGSQVSVPMMSQSESFIYAQGDGYQAIELPYRSSSASMVILLPDAKSFREFEDTLEADRLGEILDGMTFTGVSLSMPKFEYESKFQLAKTLSEMGMPAAFGPQADFSGMDGQGGLFIGSVIHQAFVSVDEEGTEAAAATAVVMLESAAPMPEVEMTIDHPFIFLIRDRDSGAILFLGRVMNPTG
jgi:serpin B